jgi:hypothetical protein
MRPRFVAGLLLTGLCLLPFFGCSTRVVVLRGGPCPAWVDKLPNTKGQLCAVGYSGPTFYQPDCVKNAAENARGHLSESISVTIKTITVDVSDGGGGYFSNDVFVQGSQSASDAVLNGSEIEAQWLDVQGERGMENGCYTMVCIDPDKPIEKLMESLKDQKLPPKAVEKVRENAEAAFKDLEAQENKTRLKDNPSAPPPPPADKAAQDAPAPEAQPSGEPQPAPQGSPR